MPLAIVQSPHKGRREYERLLPRLGNHLDRRHRDLAAGDLPGPFRIVLEEIPRLQGFYRLLVGGSGEMEIAGIVAVLHDAVENPALQLGIAVDCCNETRDFLVPGFRGAVGELVLDHEMFHRRDSLVVTGAGRCGREQNHR